MTAKVIIEKYVSFFEKQGHKRIANASLVPENDPTTLFTSSGMQPLVSYLLGEPHPAGKRLVNVQNCFRSQDIEEVGDNRHRTFFRMLGNWSLGDYFKKEQLPWFFEFLTSGTEGLGLDPERLFVTVFKGNDQIPQDKESIEIWQKLFREKGTDAKINERIFLYDVDKNWWSRSGTPDKMPDNEPGGTDSEVFFDFGTLHTTMYGEYCHPNCGCGRFMEIGNSVFMEYQKLQNGGFKELPKKNVDFGGGLERLLAAVENQNDVFKTSLLKPIMQTIEKVTERDYKANPRTHFKTVIPSLTGNLDSRFRGNDVRGFEIASRQIRIVADHFIAGIFIASSGIVPSNKEQGYILRRLLRRGLDNFYILRTSRHSGDSAKPKTPESLRDLHDKRDSGQARMTTGNDLVPIIKSIVEQYEQTDPNLQSNFEKIKNTILEEKNVYEATLKKAKDYIFKKYQTVSDELKGKVEISADDAFFLYASHGLSPTQIKSLGYVFDDNQFAQKMKEHQAVSKKGVEKKFAGGLADHSQKTIMGHTATHLMHQAIRDVLGNHVYQTGSNITPQRIRFDFNYEKTLTDEKLKKVEEIVNKKIYENLPVHFEIMPLTKAKKIGAIGLFDEKYSDMVKVYFIGRPRSEYYSVEFCGGPHVDFTKKLKKFKIIKQENIGRSQRRLYALVGL